MQQLARHSDDGIEPGEAVECFTPNAAAMRAEALSRKEGHVGARSMTEQIPDHRQRRDQQHAHDHAAADAV
jgi:hypothetical protein